MVGLEGAPHVLLPTDWDTVAAPWSLRSSNQGHPGPSLDVDFRVRKRPEEGGTGSWVSGAALCLSGQ